MFTASSPWPPLRLCQEVLIVILNNVIVHLMVAHVIRKVALCWGRLRFLLGKEVSLLLTFRRSNPCGPPEWPTTSEKTYLQRDVLQQRVLQHRLQLAVDLQRQVQGEAAVGRVRGVEWRHDAPPPAQVGLVDVGRLRREGPRLLSQHVALDDSVGWGGGWRGGETRWGQRSRRQHCKDKINKVRGGRGREKKASTENWQSAIEMKSSYREIQPFPAAAKAANASWIVIPVGRIIELNPPPQPATLHSASVPRTISGPAGEAGRQ